MICIFQLRPWQKNSLFTSHSLPFFFFSSIYGLCFNPDGSRLILAAGQKVLVYNADNGSLIEALKGSEFFIHTH